MWWLAGLMGLMGFGATSAIDTDAAKDDAEDNASANADPKDTGHGKDRDLFDAIAGIEFATQTGADMNSDAPADILDNDTANQMVDALVTDAGTTAISDFKPADDTLLFVWDDSEDEAEPDDVSVQSDPEHAGEVQVWFGDQMVAQVSGPAALMDIDIALIPFSSAQALELVEA